MDHVAIMGKSLGFLPKILSGHKSIESRWSQNKIAPFGRVKPGDKIYFKNSSEPVTATAEVAFILAEDDLAPERVRQLLNDWGGRIGIEEKDLDAWYERLRDKRFVTLIFLKNVRELRVPFDIDKERGRFGSGTAWLCVEDGIGSIKR